MKRKAVYLIITAAALFIAAAVIAIIVHSRLYLVLKNADTGEVYASFRVSENEMFSVEFIHSVNQTPVHDFYEVRGDGIYVIETHYFGFGAGVQTELNPDEILEYGADGSMQIKNINKRITDLIYVVGTSFDHVLEIKGEVISLSELCGRNSSVRFAVSNRIGFR